MAQSEKMTEYEKQRLKRIEENKARMKAMGLDKMASSFSASIPVSPNNNNNKKKGKKKVGLEDDEEYNPSAAEEESNGSSSSGSDNEYCASPMNKSKPKKSTPSKKISKLSSTSNVVDDEDEALLKAIALSLQDSQGFLDVKNKTPPQISEANASNVEKVERKQSARKDDSGKRKRKNMFTSRVQMTEDELILHFFQFDEAGKGGISLRDVQRVAASHDFTWNDEEMEHMIHFFDNDKDGKLSLEDFTKIVEHCNMRRESENAEQASMAS